MTFPCCVSMRPLHSGSARICVITQKKPHNTRFSENKSSIIHRISNVSLLIFFSPFLSRHWTPLISSALSFLHFFVKTSSLYNVHDPMIKWIINHFHFRFQISSRRKLCCFFFFTDRLLWSEYTQKSTQIDLISSSRLQSRPWQWKQAGTTPTSSRN